MTQHPNTNSSDNEPRWVTYTATADFWGDSRSSQLSFRKKSKIEVDANQSSSQVGWLWGTTGDRTGWFPEWAAEERLSSRSSHHRKNRDRIAPMLEKISEDGKKSQRSKSKKSSNDLRSASKKGMTSSKSKVRMGRRHSTTGAEDLAISNHQKNAKWETLGNDSNGTTTSSYRNERVSNSSHAESRMADFNKSFSSRSARSMSTKSVSSSSNSNEGSLNDSFNSLTLEKPVKKQQFLEKLRRRASLTFTSA
jgi:hypothetical protein